VTIITSQGWVYKVKAMNFEENKKKITGNVNIVCDADLWKDLHELHKEFGINKSDILNNFINHFYSNKDDLIKVIAPIIEDQLQQRLNEVRKLQGKVKAVSSPPIKEVITQINRMTSGNSQGAEYQGSHIGTRKNPINLKRTNYSVEFTDQGISMLNGKRDTWVHDTVSKGLAIRFKKFGKVYYTRAKNSKVGKNTIRVKIGDTSEMTLQDARKAHAKNLDYIYTENKNPNKLFPNIKHTRNTKHAVKYDPAPVVDTQEDGRDWKTFRTYTIDDLDTLGKILSEETGIIQNTLTKFKNKLSENLHQQCLDMFRDGMTIFDLRKRCFKLKDTNNPESAPITYEMCIYRLTKAIYHFGTHEEKQSFNF